MRSTDMHYGDKKVNNTWFLLSRSFVGASIQCVRAAEVNSHVMPQLSLACCFMRVEIRKLA